MREDCEMRFYCDVMLGSLARWLRAAGYDTAWIHHIEDWDLVRAARDQRRVLLSSDTGIFRIGIVRDGDVPSLFIPNGLTLDQQMALVRRELNLSLRTPRCMNCGGALTEIAKEQVRERMPPRSFAWVQQIWECSVCTQLFWEGTHWKRIAAQLQTLTAGV